MYFSSGSATTARKQTSLLRTSTARLEDGRTSGNETDGGSAELLDISTSREDLSRGASRCSCHSGESNNLRGDGKEAKESGSRAWASSNLRLEIDNCGSDDEQLKEELLRIFERERIGLESYFKQKTESILQNYRRKQYEWEENLRLEKIEYEKSLAQEKIDVQQNYISEMAKLTKQFNQERVELDCHYKKQISELSQQFERRKKEMDETIIKERTELKQRLELEYQSMLSAQQKADEQRFQQLKSELEESYKRKIFDLEQKLKEALSQSEVSGRMQTDLEAKFEKEKAVLVVEWRKRVELLELELGKEKERANKEERRVGESQGFLKKELSKKELEVEKLRQVVETLKVDLSKREKIAKEFELLQQNILLRGSDALPGKLREEFEKMLAAHRVELEQTFGKERDGLETDRERRSAIERETIEKQLRVERERMSLEVEKEREEMRRACREKEQSLREEMRSEMESMRDALEAEKRSLREQLWDESKNERIQLRAEFLNERGKEGPLRKASDTEGEERRKGLERLGTNQKLEDIKQWVGQHRVTEYVRGYVEDNGLSKGSGTEGGVFHRNESKNGEHDQTAGFSNVQGDENANVVHCSNIDEKSVTAVTVTVDTDKYDKYEYQGLKRENEGLKAKVVALQENIKLHESYKTEASEEIELLRKANKELKVKLQDTREKLKDYEEHLNDSEEKTEEYEKICEDYEKCLRQCREKILIMEKNQKTPGAVGTRRDGSRGRSDPEAVLSNGNKSKRSDERQRNDSRTSLDKIDESGSEDDRGLAKSRMNTKQEVTTKDMTIDVLRVEKERLDRVVQVLENKIRLLEQKISEIFVVNNKKDDKADVNEKKELSTNLERVRRQNRELVKKVKDLQFQLQGLVDKLRKEKKKVTILRTEYRSFKSMHQMEIKELQEKLEYSGNVIARQQNASAESSAVNRLQEEVSTISRMMVEERLNDQKMIRARSIEEIEKLKDLDREKGELERKLQDAKVALDGYSNRLKHKISYGELAGSQVSLISTGVDFLRDMRLSKTMQALEESQKTSLRQNERLLHEKKELQSLIGRLCKSREDLRSLGDLRLSLSSRSSSTSSLCSSTSSLCSSSSSFVSVDNGKGSSFSGTRFSSTFSLFD